jgi:hypothetical protein
MADHADSDMALHPMSGYLQPYQVLIDNQAERHLEDSLQFQELFRPSGFSSASRAQAFLWLCFHYLDPESQNPFADEYANQKPNTMPRLEVSTEEEKNSENIDTEQDALRTEDLLKRRTRFRRRIEARYPGEDVDGPRTVARSRCKKPAKNARAPSVASNASDDDGSRATRQRFSMPHPLSNAVIDGHSYV